MTDLRCTVRHRDGRTSAVCVTVPVEPSAWTAEDAKLVMWGLLRYFDAHGVCRVDVRESGSAVEWIIEVEAGTGNIVTQPLALSRDALLWLDERRFTLPESRGVH